MLTKVEMTSAMQVCNRMLASGSGREHRVLLENAIISRKIPVGIVLAAVDLLWPVWSSKWH